MTFTAIPTELFIDSRKVLASAEHAKKRALMHSGGLVTKTAKRSMRKRKASAAPGKPPSSHEGSLRRLTFYGWDPATKSVVSGPVRFGRSNVPALLSRGGTVRVSNKRIAVRAGGVSSSGKQFRTVSGTIRYRAFPFMEPALEKMSDRIPSAFRSSMR